jgi:aarF domain-containing kinase
MLRSLSVTKFLTNHQFKRLLSSGAKLASEQTKTNPMLKYSLIAIGSAATASAAAVKFMHDEVGGMDALNRTVNFYSLAIPKYIQYRTHMFLGSDDELWDDLDRETSQQGLDKILELGGFYIKSGQMCAANIGNGFPRIWQETMSILQDQCPSKPFPVVRSIIEADYGKPLEEIFVSFEEEPIGAASIGQVHRAKLHNGKEVVVKVMYPEVEDLFRGDVRTIKMFARVAQPVHVPPLEEVERQFMTEFDYVQEAIQMDKVRKNLEKAGLAGKNKLSVVPKPFLELCTKRVLVMEELKGEKLPEALKQDIELYAESAGMTVKEFKAREEAKVRDMKRKGEDISGPSAEEFDMYIKLIKAKKRAENVAAFLHNYTVGWLPGYEKKNYNSKRVLPINQAKLIDDLIMIHGHEVLVDGYFNGDCHPGNVLMLGVAEGKPQLGLIDYGQVKSLTKAERLRMCKIIIALANDDKKEIVRLMAEAGFKSKSMNEDVIYKYAKVSYDEDNDELTEGKHIQMFMEDLQARDPIDQLPDCYIMVGRTSVMLRGFAHALRQSRSVAKAWAPIAEKVLQSEE